MYVFNKNADNSFELFQTINSGSEDTKSVDISSDHEWIIICKTTKVFVYNFNSDDNKFKKYQTLSDSHKNEAVDMTDDHVYLIIGKINGLVLVYRFVNTSS